MEDEHIGTQPVKPNVDAAADLRVPAWLVNLITHPVTVTFSLLLLAFAFAGWYMSNHVTSEISALREGQRDQSSELSSIREGMTSNTKELSEQINATFEKFHASLELEVEGVEKELRAEIDATQKDISKDIDEVQITANTASERIDQTILEIPAASKVSGELKQTQGEVKQLSQGLVNAERKVWQIETLIKLGIRHPAVQEAIVKLIDANPGVFTSPEDIAEFWASKKDQSPREFEQFMLVNYKEINAKEAMLLAYDSLSEEKSVSFFIDIEELKASTEPAVGAAIEALEDNLFDEEKPDENIADDLSRFNTLTVISVCSVLTDVPDTACYKYFLEGGHEASADAVFADIDANKAVVRVIANKYEKLISGS